MNKVQHVSLVLQSSHVSFILDTLYILVTVYESTLNPFVQKRCLFHTVILRTKAANEN